MKKIIYLIGAGGHARSLLNLLELNRFIVSGIFDNSFQKDRRELISGYILKGKIKDIAVALHPTLVLAIGNNKERERLFHTFSSQLLHDNVIHPTAQIERQVTIGRSNQIFARAYINTHVRIGDNNILNTGCIIEHESKIGNHNHISVGAILCGRVTVRNRCFIGAGSVVIDKIKIGDDITVGANSVVVEDLKVRGVYAGNPARKMR